MRETPSSSSKPPAHRSPATSDLPFPTVQQALKDQHVWISGGIGALGLSISQTFLNNNCASLHITDILHEEAGLQIISTLTNPSKIKVTYEQVDITDEQAVRRSILPHHSVIVCGAGVANELDKRLEMDVNAFGVLHTVEATLRHAPPEDSPAPRENRTVIVISSAAGVFPLYAAPGYTMSKHAAVGYAQAISRRAWKRGVRVVTLCPAVVDAGMGLWADRYKDEVKSLGVLRKEQVSEFIMELVRRTDLVGKVVLMSQKSGARFARLNINKPFDMNYAKL